MFLWVFSPILPLITAKKRSKIVSDDGDTTTEVGEAVGNKKLDNREYAEALLKRYGIELSPMAVECQRYFAMEYYADESEAEGYSIGLSLGVDSTDSRYRLIGEIQLLLKLYYAIAQEAAEIQPKLFDERTRGTLLTEHVFIKSSEPKDTAEVTAQPNGGSGVISMQGWADKNKKAPKHLPGLSDECEHALDALAALQEGMTDLLPFIPQQAEVVSNEKGMVLKRESADERDLGPHLTRVLRKKEICNARIVAEEIGKLAKVHRDYLEYRGDSLKEAAKPLIGDMANILEMTATHIDKTCEAYEKEWKQAMRAKGYTPKSR